MPDVFEVISGYPDEQRTHKGALYTEEDMSIQILIVDDRAVVREELKNVLELTGTVSVVGEASNGWEAVHLTKALKPDIVLMDLEMPGLDGYEATRIIKAEHLAHTVIIFTVYAQAANQQKALEAGADAFVVKGTDIHDLLDLFEKLANRQSDPSNTSKTV